MKVNKKPSVNDDQSLSSQIKGAAIRLDQRKRAAMALGSSLRSRIRSAFTSPAGLSIAGGTGFMAAEWLHRPKNSSPSARKQASMSKPASARRSQTTALSKAVLLLKGALDIKRRWEKANPGVRQRTDQRRSHEHARYEPDTISDTG